MAHWEDFRSIAVLGAGFTGSRLAAHLANADLDVWLFDLASDASDPHTGVRLSLARMSQLQPPPLAAPAQLQRIVPATYQHDLRLLGQCDLVIEAVHESLDCKQGLYARIAPFLSARSVVVSATACQSISRLARALPESLRTRFCGMQFLPPPRYCELIELVPGPLTDERVLDRLESFAVQRLGKGVVRAKDTPWFIANRLGLVATALVCHHAADRELTPDTVDQVLRIALGMPPRALFGTLDELGPDHFNQSLNHARAALPDDPWLARLSPSGWLEPLFGGGRRGIRDSAGIGFDPLPPIERPAEPALADELCALLDRHQPGLLHRLADSELPEARFLHAWLHDLLHYSAVWLGTLADSARDIDLAMRWGFGLAEGPLELWQSLGWRDTAHGLRQVIAAGETLVNVPLPDWVFRVRGVYGERGAYSPGSGKYQPPPTLPVYRRWLTPPPPLGLTPLREVCTVFTTDHLRLWHAGDDIAVLDLPATPASFDEPTLDALWEALGVTHGRFQALVLWQSQTWPDQPVSLLDGLSEARIDKIQQIMLGLRHLPVPVVAAIQGRLAGFGFELAQHCDRIVAVLESYLGPVDPLRGGLPCAGGCLAMARRIAQLLNGVEGGALILRYARLIGQATVSGSALEAATLALLRPADPIVPNPRELLFVARSQAQALADSGYRTAGARLAVGGSGVLAEVRQRLDAEFAVGELDGPAYHRACQAARVLCGGDAATGTWLDESALLALEREAWRESALQKR